MADLVPRAITPNVLAALADTPVVVVNGPRQAGKTTLVRSLPYTGSVEVVSLDDPTARSAANADPRALREVLTSWVPVVLDQSDGPDVPGTELADLSFDLEETVTAVFDALDGTDRTVLRIKLAGAPDSELATALGVSRPTAAKRKAEAFDRLRAVWVRAGASGASESIRLAEELYTRLHTSGSSDA